VPDWPELATRAHSRYLDGAGRLPENADERQRQLTRMANAEYAAGLAQLMAGESEVARESFLQSAKTYRESYAGAPPGSWGRCIGAVKASLLAGDESGAEEYASWTLDEGAATSESPIGRYAATLANLTLGRWTPARVLADDLRTHEGFPTDVADALAFIAADDPVGYEEAIDDVLESFETRDAYLEDTPVADTVLALQALAAQRGFSAELESELLPS
jgi:hypothetical protein